jgi:tetratricopeptide (TPR) repeat protein
MKMNKITAVALVFLALAAATVMAAAQDEGQTPATGTAAVKAPNYTLDHSAIMAELAAAQDEAAALAVIKGTCSECRTYDDYEKLVSGIKEMAQSSSAKNVDALYYGLGRFRIEQLTCLSRSTDLESGRLYTQVNDPYYTEALQYLDKAASSTKSKSLIADINLMKFVVFKDKLQPEKADAVLEGMASDIASFSATPADNLKELYRVCGELDKMDLAKYSTKLKVLFASKTDRPTAVNVMEDVRQKAGENFAKFDMKNATYLYDQYVGAAPAYLDKEEMASSLMEIAEKYFAAGKFKDARRYYETYCASYSDAKSADYCNYRIAQCFYNDKDYVKAQEQLEGFMSKFQNSVWFDKSFEMLARTYYEKLPRQQAIENLQKLVDSYYRKNTGDFAQVLIGLLYYRVKNYDTAVEKLQKIEPSSMYHYAAQTLLNDIKEIKEKKVAPKFGSDIADTYKVWDPHTQLGGSIVPSEGGKKIEPVKAEDGSLQIQVSPGAKLQFELVGLDDDDRFNEYQADKEDLSRLPKELREETEKDLISMHWATESGSYSDDKESVTKTWQAPSEPGTYKITAKLDDFGLVRVPDKGLRKDSAKDLVLTVIVK